MAHEEATKPNPTTTFAARAAANQGDIIDCEPNFRVSGSRRIFTSLHEAVLTQNKELVEKLCREHPELAKVKDSNGDMPAHVCARAETPSDICGMVIEAFPEALVLRNNKGFVPGTIAMKNPAISRDVKNMMQDGRTTHRGNWVYDRYEKERHAHAVDHYNQKAKRSMEADAVRHAVAGYVAPRNKAVFLSAHESAR